MDVSVCRGVLGEGVCEWEGVGVSVSVGTEPGSVGVCVGRAGLSVPPGVWRPQSCASCCLVSGAN